MGGALQGGPQGVAKLDKVRKGQGDRCQEACGLTPTFLGGDLGRKNGVKTEDNPASEGLGGH